MKREPSLKGRKSHKGTGQVPRSPNLERREVKACKARVKRKQMRAHTRHQHSQR